MNMQKSYVRYTRRSCVMLKLRTSSDLTDYHYRRGNRWLLPLPSDRSILRGISAWYVPWYAQYPDSSFHCNERTSGCVSADVPMRVWPGCWNRSTDIRRLAQCDCTCSTHAAMCTSEWTSFISLVDPQLGHPNCSLLAFQTGQKPCLSCVIMTLLFYIRAISANLFWLAWWGIYYNLV